MKRIIKTTNWEIYSKLNMLAISPDVVLKNVSQGQITKIVNNINKHGNVLSVEQIGDYLLLRKQAPLDFDVYFVKKK